MPELWVWAPAARQVDVVLDEPDAPDEHRLAMVQDGEHWRVDLDAPVGTRYSFSVDGGAPLPDPRGLRLPDGPHGPSALYDPGAFAWSDSGWSGVPLDGAVLYELHVGTFTRRGTLDAAAEHLGHLVDLGVTVVELMPVAPFPGEHGWGYDGVAPYAVHEPYGGPEALQRFVDEAHRLGLGVCLDVVYNHLGPDGNVLPEFGPYLTDTHSTPWGQALNLDAPGSDAVRRWVIDNALQWLRDFHIDGLRLDAVHELKDGRAVHVLEELSSEVDAFGAEAGRAVWLVAESDRNDVGTVTPRGDGDTVGGLGLHGQWADDVHHALHVALTGETQGYYEDFADPAALPKVMCSPFFHDGSYSAFRGRSHGRPVDRSTVPGWRFVASLQTHDQVGNRAAGDRLSASLDPGLLAAGAALLLTSPWTPMLFMGEEWGATTPWQYFTDHQDPELADAVREGRREEFAEHGWRASEVPDPQRPATVNRSTLDWSEPDREPHTRLLNWYRELLRARREVPDLRDGDLTRVEARWDAEARRMEVRRGEHVVLANLGDAPWTTPASGSVLLSWEPGVEIDGGSVTVPPRSALVVAP